MEEDRSRERGTEKQGAGKSAGGLKGEIEKDIGKQKGGRGPKCKREQSVKM